MILFYIISYRCNNVASTVFVILKYCPIVSKNKNMEQEVQAYLAPITVSKNTEPLCTHYIKG